MPPKPKTQIGSRQELDEKIYKSLYWQGLLNSPSLIRDSKKLLKLWKKYKKPFMARYMKEMKERGGFAKRPRYYFGELEAQHPRHKTYDLIFRNMQHTVEEGEEEDEQYLARLGLLEPWEYERWQEWVDDIDEVEDPAFMEALELMGLNNGNQEGKEK